MDLSEFQTVKFSEGETIFHEGEQGNCAYVILSGTVRVHKEDCDLATLEHNQMIGEMSLISPGPRTASVTALTKCEMLLLDQSQFSQRQNDLDPVMRLVFDVILSRFRNTLHSVGHPDGGANINEYSLASSMKDVLTQLRFEADIKRGIGTDEFELFYQPIVCLESGKLVGAEGLMRWKHPLKGWIQPGDFIPAAETSSQITELTKIGLDQICSDLREFNISTLKNPEAVMPMFGALNVSGKDLEHDLFYEHVSQNLEKYNVADGALKLEVTETSLMKDIRSICEKLSSLQKKGVRIAIDDFGTGYSNMSYLAQLPLSTLKIDRSFIVGLSKGRQSRKITNAILKLAMELDLTIVAEGIELQSDVDFLRWNNCTYGQGYLYSRPVPLSEFLIMIENWCCDTVNNKIQPMGPANRLSSA